MAYKVRREQKGVEYGAVKSVYTFFMAAIMGP